jgi:hypothetical protein
LVSTLQYYYCSEIKLFFFEVYDMMKWLT